jgi:tetratricopeptide (TPR) repeat protein
VDLSSKEGKLGLFGFNAEKKLKKADDYLAREIYYEAKLAYEEIIMRDGVEASIIERAREGWRQARQALMEEQTAEAKRLVRAGEPDQAVESCRAALEQAGNDLDASEARELLEKLGQGGTAAEKLLQGLDEIPSSGDAAPAPVDEEDAVASGPEALFEVLLQSLPAVQAEAYDSFGPEFRAGFLELQEGRAKEALAAFSRVPEEVGASPFFRLEKAQALMQDEQSEDALQLLEGLELPEEVERRRLEMNAVLFQRLQRGEEALQAALRLWEAHPEDPDVAVLYAEVLSDQNRPQEALDILMPFHEEQSSPEIASLVARCYVATDRAQEARDLLEGTVEAFFQNPAAMNGRFPLWAARELLRFYVGVKEDPGRVRSLVQHLIRHDPASAESYKLALKRYADEMGADGG